MSASTVSYVVWGLLGAAVVGLGVLSRAGWLPAATPGAALARVARGPLLRIVGLLVVAWLGWHLFAR